MLYPNVLPVEDPQDTDILELELLLEHEDKDGCDRDMETLLDSKKNNKFIFILS